MIFATSVLPEPGGPYITVCIKSPLVGAAKSEFVESPPSLIFFLMFSEMR